MSYRLRRSPQAQRQLNKLRKTHNPLHNEIVDAIQALAENPRPIGCKKLTERPEWRIRVGNYRILYRIDDTNKVVTITAIGHRRQIYR